MADRKFVGVRPIGIAVALLLAAALIVPTVATADPAAVPVQTPSVATVQQQLGDLALKNAQLAEQYNRARIDVVNRQAAAAKAEKAAAQIDVVFQAARTRLASSAAAQYESGSFSTTGALLSSDSGQSYLNQLATLSMLSAHNAQVVTNVTAIKAQADTAQTTAATLLATAAAKRDELVKQKDTVQKQVDKYTTLLDTLTAAQRTAYIQTVAPTAKVAPAAIVVQASSAAATQAVKFALAQVGKPYVFGAGGPGSYDCSGLTMAAWAAGGVSLPHLAADQYNYGHHVNMNELQPGDLIFYGSPAYHVTIYVGSGLMVSAPQPGENVKVMPSSAMSAEVSGATRLVG